MYKFLNPCDPASKGIELWHFVYMHGEAEIANQKQQKRNRWKFEPYDLCVCAEEMPTIPGEYRGELYGREVIVVLSIRKGIGLSGRAAYADDIKAVEHCRRPDDWR